VKINNDRRRKVEINGFGIPFGGLGTGYGVFGRYGFLRENFNSTPDVAPALYPACGEEFWQYNDNPAFAAPYAFILKVDGKEYVLQEQKLEWLPQAKPVKKVEVEAEMPKGYFRFRGIPGVEVKMTAFSPLIPGDISESNIPVQVFDFELKNTGKIAKNIELQLRHRFLTWINGTDRKFNVASGPWSIYNDLHGQAAFQIVGGEGTNRGAALKLDVAAGKNVPSRALLAWHYPYFKTPSPCDRNMYRRYYTLRFAHVLDVLEYAAGNADKWSAAIDRWHDSYNVPGAFSRLWFSSLSSIVTGTMMADTGEYFEIETPHYWINTMDVSVYTSWCVMVNWPELERKDMEQYYSAIHTSGELAGFVWHSLWDDASHYEEEPTFMLRVLRDLVWLRDRDFVKAVWPTLVMVMERVLRNCTPEGLICSPHGNQSYDAWKMPGISAYVNSAWVYALHAFEQAAKIVGMPETILGRSASELCRKAAAALDKLLWNEKNGSWNCFDPQGIETENVGESIFLEQMFGRWALAEVADTKELFDVDRMKRMLQTLHSNNLIEDEGRFRGWSNGMLPGGKPDMCSYHAKTCWMCSQLNLGSLLGLFGDEDKSLDVFASIEMSLGANILAVGEWNQAVDAKKRPVTLPEEPGKDTARFPSYPRYKSAWEWLPRLLGMKLDFDSFYFQPFRKIDFELNDITLGGSVFSISVEKGWTKCLVNGKPVSGDVVKLSRDVKKYKLSFVK